MSIEHGGFTPSQESGQENEVNPQEIADLSARLDQAVEDFSKISDEYYNQGIQWDIGYVASLGKTVKDLEDQIRKVQESSK